MFEKERLRPGDPKIFYEFVKRHGDVWIKQDGQLLFSDGAIADVTAHIFTEPPSDPTRLLKAKRRYVEAKLEKEITDFKNYQAECQSMAQWAAQNSSCCPPPANAAEQLEQGNKRIKALRKQLAEFDKELGETPEAQKRRKSEEIDRVRRQNLNRQMREINNIKI